MLDAVIIGGGIAGWQAAIQLGRYKHEVLVIDAGYGRSTLCRNYHNILGWPQGISGLELRELGKNHATQLGVSFINDEVLSIDKKEEGFVMKLKQDIEDETNQKTISKTILLATGVLDRFPNLPGLVNCLGRSIYICPDCDGYEASGKRTIVLGSGNAGASMAISLTYWTDNIVYINHEQKKIDLSYKERLREHSIEVRSQPIGEVIEKQGYFEGMIFVDGEMIYGDKAFIAFGHNHVKTDLAHQLGVERMENNHIVTDPRTKMTNIPHVWAAGDIGVHSEQVTIAMGEGSQAAIWMHKSLLKMTNRRQLTYV